MVDTIQNTFARLASALPGSEMGKIQMGELRDVERLFHLEDEAEITQNELADLANREIAENLGEKEEISQLQEKEKEKKEANVRILKLKQEIEKIDLGELIIDRSETPGAG